MKIVGGELRWWKPVAYQPGWGAGQVTGNTYSVDFRVPL